MDGSIIPGLGVWEQPACQVRAFLITMSVYVCIGFGFMHLLRAR